MQLEIRRSPGVVHVSVRGTMLHTDGPELCRALRRAVLYGGVDAVSLDLSGLALMDSFGMYALVDFCYWLSQQRTAQLEIRLNARLVELFRIGRMNQLLDSRGTELEETVRSVFAGSSTDPLGLGSEPSESGLRALQTSAL